MRKDNEIVHLGRGQKLDRLAQVGVSLHCHTLCSQELLDFVPHYANRIPIASYFWRRHMRRYEKTYGKELDFSTGYWTPPLTGPDVFDSEENHLNALGISAIVSITDHDSITASTDNAGVRRWEHAPISMEWTVPFETGFFHLGVHNLPFCSADAISSRLLEYTNAAEEGPSAPDKLCDLLRMLNEYPGVLVVLNHPIWDIEMIGQAAHEALLSRFLDEHAFWIHAIEVNGFRSWQENQTAIELARSLALPIVSGGDRHCLQPNAMINLTNATSFAEFVEEVRVQNRSFVAVTPEYHRPLPSRQLRSIRQILSFYPEFPNGRRDWTDRVHLDFQDGRGVQTLSEAWKGTKPIWTYPTFAALRLLTHPILESFVGLAFGDTDIGRDERRWQKTEFGDRFSKFAGSSILTANQETSASHNVAP